MPKAVLLMMLFIPIAALSEERIGKFTWDYAYVDLNKQCNSNYSLYPAEVECIKGQLYAKRYKITYTFHGEHREAYLSYIPGKNTLLDENGNIKPRDLTIKESQ